MRKAGAQWQPLIVAEFRTFLGVQILMGVKKLPTVREYWSSARGCLHSGIINAILT